MIPFLVAFLLPIFIILIFNVVIYVLVICVVILHTIGKNKRMNKSPLTTSDAIKMLLSYFGILILFGLTWLFAVFTFITEPNISFIIQFFFAFFNTFQGFFIFFFFVVLSSDSRDAWKSLLCPWTVRDGMASTVVKNKTSNIQIMSPQAKNAPESLVSIKGKGNKGKDFAENLIFENETILEDSGFSNDDEFMISEFGSIRFDRHLSARRKHYVEKIEIDFFADSDDSDGDI
ncbi:PREDICTED: adhesion G-protein coupled receptor G2-like [Amphimedon queenslandica]|uniref:G-protein coupled receptors family 2 profile 2 domain-containing protein n=2 Tax=Amphimedon queenslandica TaxID=400682 RepID=A0AAN0K372_AMPQE|nr:PREDICTED: adhesion G-protein coupled receptor G2-like [Amphimedon queenslandica]|eukprot:XP_019863597.1 PREDICTED: adhesion G-protein coupled receptor G2-like [Amphimedon queenslandica]